MHIFCCRESAQAALSSFRGQKLQGFEIARYQRAVPEGKGVFTDDCQMLESNGQPVYLPKGDYINPKITTPVDLLTAQAIVLAQEGERL